MHPWLQQTALALVLAAGFAALPAAPALAAAPMVKTQAPGYYRMMLGDFEITAISDGTVDLPMTDLLKGMPKPALDKTFAEAYLKVPVETSVNGFLINTGSKLILIDSGAGGLFGPTLGRFVANLKAAGYQPEQVDEIYVTHMHPDHVGGLSVDGKPVFPNAILRAQKHESDFWLSQANMDKAPADSKGSFKGAMASVNPYVAAGKYQPFEGDAELAPGVKAHAGKGHTPGHSTYVVSSKGQTLVLIGDQIHAGAVQFPHPEVVIAFDSDSKTAAAERKQDFDALAKDGALVGAAHLPFPGLGHIRAQGKAYQWLPLNYTR
jgi:glyoxylase-like metal-dependent hydrolase (beta-lactamase superfamily II)